MIRLLRKSQKYKRFIAEISRLAYKDLMKTFSGVALNYYNQSDII